MDPRKEEKLGRFTFGYASLFLCLALCKAMTTAVVFYDAHFSFAGTSCTRLPASSLATPFFKKRSQKLSSNTYTTPPVPSPDLDQAKQT